MKKTLQRKFVLNAMGAITALLLVLLAAINLYNWYLVEQQTDRMLQTVLQGDRLPIPKLPPDQGGPPPGWREVLPEDMQADIRAAARHKVLSMLALSTGGVALCWLGMLALVMVLSRRSIRPIALSIEKQKEFVTNAGHELKTPLAIIRANTEAMELHQGENKWTRNIKAQTLRLGGLMENLLTLARMEETDALPPARPVDLSSLARESAESFREAAALRGILLEEIIDPAVILQGDREHLAQLLSILLDNGVKYTDPGGAIRLTLTGEGKGARLRVENAPARLEGETARLFDRFYRGDPARTQRTGGCGIGLSAAQAIVRAWRGTITAGMEGEDRVVFTVELPGL